MSTKNISRTAIEGGRLSYNKFERGQSSRDQRAANRDFCGEAKLLVDADDAKAVPDRRPVRKEFGDKLSPAYRWIRSQVGRKWDSVFHDLCETFDTRTTAGRHIVYSHMLRDIDMQGIMPIFGRSNFFVDDNGILQLSEDNRWTRKKFKYHPIGHEIELWAKDRRVAHLSPGNIFWLVPDKTEWKECTKGTKGYGCTNGRHRPATKEELVNKIVTYYSSTAGEHSPRRIEVKEYEKAFLRKETANDGFVLYYRTVATRECLQRVGDLKPGARFTSRDIEMWNKIGQSDRDRLIELTSAQIHDREIRRKQERKKQDAEYAARRK